MSEKRFKAVIFSTGAAIAAALLLFFSGASDYIDLKIYCKTFALKNIFYPVKTDSNLMQVNISDKALDSLEKDWSLGKTLFTALEESSSTDKNIFFAADIFYKIPDISLINYKFTSLLDEKNSLLPVTILPEEIYSVCKKENTEEEKELIGKSLVYPQIFNGKNIPSVSYIELPPEKYAKKAESLAVISQGSLKECLTKAPLFYKYQDGYLPSFALAFAAKKLKIDFSTMTLDCGKEFSCIYGSGKILKVPVDKEGKIFIPYLDNIRNAVPKIDFDFFSKMKSDSGIERTVRSMLKNKSIIFTQSLAEKKDFIQTPLQGTAPSYTADIAVLNALLTERFIRSYPLWAKALTAFLCILGLLSLTTIKKEVLLNLAIFLFTFIITGIQVFLFIKFNIVLWIFLPVFFILFFWLIFTAQEHIIWR